MQFSSDLCCQKIMDFFFFLSRVLSWKQISRTFFDHYMYICYLIWAIVLYLRNDNKNIATHINIKKATECIFLHAALCLVFLPIPTFSSASLGSSRWLVNPQVDKIWKIERSASLHVLARPGRRERTKNPPRNGSGTTRWKGDERSRESDGSYERAVGRDCTSAWRWEGNSTCRSSSVSLYPTVRRPSTLAKESATSQIDQDATRPTVLRVGI